jgi:hypothetical protein
MSHCDLGNRPADRVIRVLRGSGHICCDTLSGERDDRPGVAALLDYVRDGDTVVVCKLDRLGRNTLHILETVNELTDCGVTLVARLSIAAPLDLDSSDYTLTALCVDSRMEVTPGMCRPATANVLAAEGRADIPSVSAWLRVLAFRLGHAG